MTLGLQIKNRRMQLGLTQTELARDLCTPSLISQIEADKAIPSETLLSKIAARLGRSPEDFAADPIRRVTLESIRRKAEAWIAGGQALMAIEALQADLPYIGRDRRKLLLYIGDLALQNQLYTIANKSYLMVDAELPVSQKQRFELYQTLWPRQAISWLFARNYGLAAMMFEKMYRWAAAKPGALLPDSESFSLMGLAALAYLNQDYRNALQLLTTLLDKLPRGESHAQRAAVYHALSVVNHQLEAYPEAIAATEIASTIWKTSKRIREDLQLRCVAASAFVQTGSLNQAEYILQSFVRDQEKHDLQQRVKFVDFASGERGNPFKLDVFLHIFRITSTGLHEQCAELQSALRDLAERNSL